MHSSLLGWNRCTLQPRRGLFASAAVLVLTTLVAFPVATFGQSTPAPAPATPAKKDVETLDTYVVEGTKEKPLAGVNVDLPRGIDDVKPYYVFDSKSLESSGALTIQDYLFQRLPMNTEPMTLAQNVPTNVAAGLTTVSMINLRALGTDQTLILVNGRRLAISGNRGVDRQPDVNGIPMGAVDRIEVMPSSASGIYGGGAVGGVINIILKRNYAGGEVRANYANTFDSDTPTRRYELLSGFTFEKGKTHVMISGSYADGKPMVRGDRASIYNEGLARFRAVNPVTVASVPLGRTPNIYSTAGINLTLKNGGTPLNALNTFIPVGYKGTTTDNSAALVANAGKYNTDFANLPFIGLQQPTNSPIRTRSAQFSVRRQMNDNIEVFFDGTYTSNASPMNRGALLSAASATANSPVNPFNQAVSIYFPAIPAAPAWVQNQVRMLSAGVHAKLPHNWVGQFDFSWSDARNGFSLGSTVTSAINTAITAGTLNPFVDTGLYPIDLSAFMSTIVGDYRSVLNDTSARFYGPIYTLPGGDLSLAASVSSRFQKQVGGSYEATTQIPNPAANNTNIYLPQSQRTDSGYVELTVPLFGGTNAREGLNLLDLQFAARQERYYVNAMRTASGGINYPINAPVPAVVRGSANYVSTDPTLGLRYKPTPDIMARVSYSTAFRPPSYSQLTSPRISDTASTLITDPRRGGSYSIYTLSGGNPDLVPETAKNWTAGVVFTPRFAKGLRVSVDYTRIEKQNNLNILSAQVLIDNESLFPDRIIRAAPVAPATVGLITSVDTTYLNLFRSMVEAVDFSVGYRMRTEKFGSFDFNSVATHHLHYKQQITYGAPYRDYINFTQGGAISYRGNATVTWEFRRWTAGWTANYSSSYNVFGPPINTTLQYINANGSTTVPSQMYHDVVAGYRFPTGNKRWYGRVSDRLEIQAGVKNLFNKRAPYDAYYSSNGFLSPYGNLQLANYWVAVKKGF